MIVDIMTITVAVEVVEERAVQGILDDLIVLEYIITDIDQDQGQRQEIDLGVAVI